jgi:hypothetical protein
MSTLSVMRSIYSDKGKGMLLFIQLSAQGYAKQPAVVLLMTASRPLIHFLSA